MSDDVIDNYDLDNNALFIRGCNLIDIADENRYLQNAWFALIGNLLNEEQMDLLIQNTNAELQKTDPTAKLQAMHQLINVLPSFGLKQRFMMLLSQVEVSAAQGKVMAPVSDGDCLKIILLMPWIIALACSSQQFSDLPAIENCNTLELAFWLVLTSKEASSNSDIDVLCGGMSLLLGGFGIVTPTTTMVRFIISTKSDVISALIGGFCATGPAHMGACKYAIMRLSGILHEIEAGNFEAAVTHYCKDKLWLGFGHPIMQWDGRVDFFFSRFQVPMCPFNSLVRSISDNTGLQPNVDFLIASIMSKHRASPELGLLAFFVCRMPILLAHYQARFSAHSFGLSSKDLREKYKKVSQLWL
ncbi:citrate/2-methylcitrate synthase [Bartonella taylorii]|uniref:citrate/2-methylcitrate synthase n=1 Tax=Bartonella taylorii TaxID=33046 RepID=UPI001ABB8A1E|nr:citrate/2-methylcitrate synthase [Bartonella taylorii]